MVNKKMKKRFSLQKSGDKLFDAIVIIILGILFLVWFFPLFYVFMVSFTPASDAARGGLFIIPSRFTLEGYKYLLKSSNIFRSLFLTISMTVFGTTVSMIISILTAYPLSKKRIPGRGPLLYLFVFTMYFSGGLIPTYLVMKSLKVLNTVYAMILPQLLNVFNMLLIKSYFESLPQEMYDAAAVDGCSSFRTLIQIAIPLSKPVLFTIMLFYMVSYWNTYYNYLYYCWDPDLQPLQYVLRMIINLASNAEAAVEEYIPTTTVQMSAIVIAATPIICVYPFIQKHFTKGIMLGGIKG